MVYIAQVSYPTYYSIGDMVSVCIGPVYVGTTQLPISAP